MTVAKAIARAWADAAYKTKLVSDPHAALSEAGVSVPTGTTVKVIENTADTVHVVLPAAPAKASEMSIDELEKVAGGLALQDVWNNVETTSSIATGTVNVGVDGDT